MPSATLSARPSAVGGLERQTAASAALALPWRGAPAHLALQDLAPP